MRPGGGGTRGGRAEIQRPDRARRTRREAWPELHEEIGRLPERYREPVVLCYLEGLSTDAAALRLGCPKGTVLSRLSRARERLREPADCAGAGAAGRRRRYQRPFRPRFRRA